MLFLKTDSNRNIEKAKKANLPAKKQITDLSTTTKYAGIPVKDSTRLHGQIYPPIVLFIYFRFITT